MSSEVTIKMCFHIRLEGRKWNCWPLLYIFGSKDLAGKILIKMMINIITQIQDVASIAKQDQL